MMASDMGAAESRRSVASGLTRTSGPAGSEWCSYGQGLIRSPPNKVCGACSTSSRAILLSSARAVYIAPWVEAPEKQVGQRFSRLLCKIALAYQ